MTLSAEGCAHRHSPFDDGAGPHECRRYPAEPCLGGTREHPQTVHRFRPCTSRCGEYVAAEPPPAIPLPSTPPLVGSVEITRTDQGAVAAYRPIHAGLTCRGCYALGSACGNCSRCTSERQRMKVGDLVRHRFGGDDFISVCEVYQVEHVPSQVAPIVRIREAMGGREAVI